MEYRIPVFMFQHTRRARSKYDTGGAQKKTLMRWHTEVRAMYALVGF
jgi:hypothetical protein